MDHSHVMGGSTAARRISCPGSLNAEKAVPDGGHESEYAVRGSMLHAAMELLLTADPDHYDALEKLLDELEGQDLGFKSDEFPDMEITRELIDDKLRPAWDAWVRVCDEYGIEDWFIEQRVSMQSRVPGAFGTADVIAVGEDTRYHGLDWKFGDGVPVPAKENLGMAFYAGAALYDEDDELLEFMHATHETDLVLHIVQPRTGSHDDPLDSWETTWDWVEDVVDLAEEAIRVATTLGDEAPRHPGDHCKFCKAHATCPAVMEAGELALDKSPTEMTTIDLTVAVNMAHQLDQWCKEVFKIAHEQAMQGVSIPGWKLVDKRPTRVWANEKKAESALKRKFKTAGAYAPRKLISPAQAEKKDKAFYSKSLAKHVSAVSSGLTLVPDSDKRQAVTNAATLLAEHLPEQK